MIEKSVPLTDQLHGVVYRLVKRFYSPVKSGPGRIIRTKEQTKV